CRCSLLAHHGPPAAPVDEKGEEGGMESHIVAVQCLDGLAHKVIRGAVVRVPIQGMHRDHQRGTKMAQDPRERVREIRPSIPGVGQDPGREQGAILPGKWLAIMPPDNAAHCWRGKGPKRDTTRHRENPESAPPWRRLLAWPGRAALRPGGADR